MEFPWDVLTFGLKSVSFRSDYPRSTGRREREGEIVSLSWAFLLSPPRAPKKRKQQQILEEFGGKRRSRGQGKAVGKSRSREGSASPLALTQCLLTSPPPDRRRGRRKSMWRRDRARRRRRRRRRRCLFHLHTLSSLPCFSSSGWRPLSFVVRTFFCSREELFSVALFSFRPSVQCPSLALASPPPFCSLSIFLSSPPPQGVKRRGRRRRRRRTCKTGMGGGRTEKPLSLSSRN